MPIGHALEEAGWRRATGGRGSVVRVSASLGLTLCFLVVWCRPGAAQHVTPPAEPAEATPRPEGEGASAESTEAPRAFRWRWAGTDVGNYVLIGIAGATVGAMIGTGAAGAGPRREGAILFDEPARDAIRLPEETQRLVARDVSDGLLSLMMSSPLILDALLLAAWQHDDPDTAFELAMIHAEVLAVTFALQTIANIAAGRERPYGRTCGGGGDDDLPEDSFFCRSPDRNYSFFSGHTSQSFAAAATVCSAHLNLPLLGGGAVEMAPCIAGFAFAAATGALRIMGDMHYATDVLTGAAVGTLVGFLLPWALHYSRPRSGESGDASDTQALRVSVVPSGPGAALVGWW